MGLRDGQDLRMTSYSEDSFPKESHFSRRGLLVGGGLASIGVALGIGTTRDLSPDNRNGVPPSESLIPFFGTHQAGIATPPQNHLLFGAFDVTTSRGDDLRAMLNAWSQAAAAMTAGQVVGTTTNTYAPPVDTGEARGLPAAGLTITIGYGPGLFTKDFGLAAPQLQPLPNFPGDNLTENESYGDIAIQCCADDPQVAFHALHMLARMGLGVVQLRYSQLGFGRTSATTASQDVPRNLLGFKDGIENLRTNGARDYARFVWIDPHASTPRWQHHGTTMVVRKIRTHIESWSSSSLDTQEAVIGRFKDSGAPLSGSKMDDAPDFSAVDQYNNYVIPSSSHVRLASQHSNGGMTILRRGYGYSEGISPQSGEMLCGLYFICFQKDPHQFVTVQNSLSLADALNDYIEHVSSAVFAIPGGLAKGDAWGDQLFRS